MHYYERIKQVREQRQKTQIEIATLLETSQKQYSRWETGEREFPVHTVIILSKYYNLSIDYILGLTNEERPLTPMREKE